MKVLIAEDDKIISQLLGTFVSKLGHDCTYSMDGQEALKKWEEGSFDLIMLDWMMPKVNGIDVCRHIKKSAKGKYCFVLMVTAKAKLDDLEIALDAGANDYLPKPVDRKELLFRLRIAQRWLELNRKYLEAKDNAEQQLAFTQNLIDSIPAPVIFKGQDLTYKSVNNAFLNFTGFNKEEVLGKTTPDIFPKASAAIHEMKDQQLVNELSKKGSKADLTSNYEFSIRNKDGEVRTLRACKSLTFTSSDELYGVISSFFDVTDLRHLEDRLRRENCHLEVEVSDRNKQIESMGRLVDVGTMVAGTVHEINNSMTVLGAVGPMLQKVNERLCDLRGATEDENMANQIGNLTQVIMEMADDVNISINRVKNIVSSLLKQSRDVKLEANPERFCIFGIFDELKGFIKMRSKSQDKHIVVEENIQAENISAFADQHHIFHIAANLCANAVDAAGKNGKIILHINMAKDDMVEFSVADNGSGIPQDIADEIFTPFFTTKEPGKGTGLGLPLCRTMTTNNGGTLELDTTYTNGAKFVLKLPHA